MARGCRWCLRGSETRPERREGRWVLGSQRRCRDDMGCSGQRDGAPRLSEVGSKHGRDDNIGHSDGQCEDSVGVGGTAREPAGGPVLADDDGSV